MQKGVIVPREDIPRLFVGNISPSVTDEALRRALSNFGSVESLVRTNNYAHASFNPRDGSQIAKLLSVLNKAKWGGLELRVEHAKPHYLQKLRREWGDSAKAKNSKITSNGKVRHLVNIGGAVNYRSSMNVQVQFQGAHKIFPEDDEEAYQERSFQDVFCELFGADYGEHSDAMRTNIRVRPEKNEDEIFPGIKTFVRKQGSLETVDPVLESTIALFGLDGRDFHDEGTKKDNSHKHPFKQERKGRKDKADETLCKDEVSSEVSRALKVAESMLADKNEVRSDRARKWIDEHRKRGLWRTLSRSERTNFPMKRNTITRGRRTTQGDTSHIRKRGLFRTLLSSSNKSGRSWV